MVPSLFGTRGSALVAFAAVLLATPGLIIDRGRIIFGDPDGTVDRVAVVDVPKAERKTAAWKKLESENPPAEDPRRALLLAEAKRAVRAAVARVAEAGGYDLVGEMGSIIVRGRTVPEITAQVIAALEETEK